MPTTDLAFDDDEMLDGFFPALACSPHLVMPSEFLEVLQSGATEDDDLVFKGSAEAERVIDLVMRQWNHVNAQITAGEIYLPLLMEGPDGVAHPNDWARGFLAGTHLRHALWADLLHDNARRGPLIPILALAHEHHSNSEMRPFPRPIPPGTREELLVQAVAGVMKLHAMLRADADLSRPTARRSGTRRRRSAATIPARAGRERNSRRAAGRAPRCTSRRRRSGFGKGERSACRKS
jgi:uncharacterized protein